MSQTGGEHTMAGSVQVEVSRGPEALWFAVSRVERETYIGEGGGGGGWSGCQHRKRNVVTASSEIFK